MAGISRLFNRDTQIRLTFSEPNVYIVFFYDGKSASLGEIVEKWPEVRLLQYYFRDASFSRYVVPVKNLEEIRKACLSLKQDCVKYSNKLHFIVDETVQSLVVLQTPPTDFVVRYKKVGNQLVREYSTLILETEDGWFLKGNQYWHYPDLSPELLSYLQKKAIPANLVLSYTRDFFPAFRHAGVKVESDLEYREKPSVLLEIHDVSFDRVRLRPVWSVDPQNVEEGMILPEHVVADGFLQPGLKPSELQPVMSDVQADTELSGEAIASFLDKKYKPWKKWITGKTEEFESIHCWIEKPFYWILSAKSDLRNGVGKSVAEAVACIGKERVTVQKLKDAQEQAYFHFPSGWVRATDLYTLGLNLTDLSISGAPSRLPLQLTAQQIVCRGDSQLNTLWRGMVVNGPELSVSIDKHRNAQTLLRYLIHWGLKGGITGGYEAFAAYVAPFIVEHLKGNPDCRILVAAFQEDLVHVRTVMEDEKAISVELYEKIAQNSAVLKSDWDLVILIEPDAGLSIQSRKSAIEKIVRIHTRSLICCAYDLSNAETNRWMANLLGYADNLNLYGILMQDCRKMKEVSQFFRFRQQLPDEELYDCKSSPEPENQPMKGTPEKSDAVSEAETAEKNGPVSDTRPAEKSVAVSKAGIANKQDGSVEINKRQDVFVEINIGTGQSTPSIPIPQKNNSAIAAVPAVISSANARFFADARRYVNHSSKPVNHYPFTSYAPAYSDMNANQMAWYFYLRTCIRGGEYPDTDLSYLFIHIYELINLIGVKDMRDGYRQLMTLWSHYRDRYPSLDKYLGGWMTDYIHVYPCKVDIYQLLHDAPSLSQTGVNIALSRMIEDGILRMPAWMTETISQYRYSGSKFYQLGHQKLMDRMIPEVISAIDEEMRAKTRKGILDTYANLRWYNDQVPAFSGAKTEIGFDYKVRIKHFQSGIKIREYLRNVLRFTENTLREKEHYGSKLQGITLDDLSAKVIRKQIQTEYSRKAPEPKKQVPAERKQAPRIVLDASSLQKLRVESDAVRDALLTSTGKENEGDPVYEHGIQRPEDAQDGMLTDLNPVNQVLEKLTGSQRSILVMLREKGWTASKDEISRRYRGMIVDVAVDEINEQALAYLGLFLIEIAGDQLIISEDYRDELEYLLRSDEESAAKEIALNVQPDKLNEELGEEWTEFFKCVNLEALIAAAQGEVEIRAYAKSHGTMPDIVRDEINQVASDTIGDLILDENGVFEDYQEIIETCLQEVK